MDRFQFIVLRVALPSWTNDGTSQHKGEYTKSSLSCCVIRKKEKVEAYSVMEESYNIWYVQNCIAMRSIILIAIGMICSTWWSLNEYTYFIFTTSICSQLELESICPCILYCHRSRLPPSLNVCFVWSHSKLPLPPTFKQHTQIRWCSK